MKYPVILVLKKRWAEYSKRLNTHRFIFAVLTVKVTVADPGDINTFRLSASCAVKFIRLARFACAFKQPHANTI